jgi:hypothetical protein
MVIGYPVFRQVIPEDRYSAWRPDAFLQRSATQRV